MKVKGTSEFHGESVSVTFQGLKLGRNVRKLRGPRGRYCLDYSHTHSRLCGCGFPASRTEWEAPKGFQVDGVELTGKPGNIGAEWESTHIYIWIGYED